MSVSTVDATFRTQFQNEFSFDFEREESYLRQAVNSDGVPNADTMKWDVVDLSDSMKTRQRDGKIPTSQMDQSQVSATIEAGYMKYTIDNFDVFRANPNVRAAQRRKLMAAANRAIDTKIINTANTTTNELSASAVDFSDFNVLIGWTDQLWGNDVPSDGNVYGIVSNRAFANMLKIDEFKSADYVPIGAIREGVPAQGRAKEWLGVKWIMTTGVPGHGTSTADCLLWHKSSLGHAIKGDPVTDMGFNSEERQYWCLAELFHAAALTLPRGVVRAIHNDSTALYS